MKAKKVLTPRDIDALIASKVMKWKRGEQYSIGVSDRVYVQGRIKLDWGIEWDGDDSFSPSTRIADAWRVVDRMLKIVPQEDIHIEHLKGCGWSVSSCHEEDGWENFVNEKTCTRAICMAALRMVRGKKK